MKRVTFDFETRSKCDLKKAGAYKYSLDPSTQPTCLSFKIQGEKEVRLLKFNEINTLFFANRSYLPDVFARLIPKGYLFVAHNAYFERCIYTNILMKRYGWPRIPFNQYRCTAAKAAACALPRNLEGAGAAMKLQVQKDKRGYIAMMATCRPTKAWNAWKKMREEIALRNKEGKGLTPKQAKWFRGDIREPKVFLEPEDAPEVWNTLYEYCKIDVAAEELLDSELPDLNEEEQAIWHLNQTLNWRGLRIDIPTVEKIVGIMAEESKKKLKELDSLTMGLVTKPGARQSILEFLALEGVELPDLRAKTVEDKLQGFELSEDMHRLLEIRKALSLTSTRKYQSFLNRANDDERVRDILLYHGASTGRDTGTGIQPQNFPRGLIRVDKDRPYAAVENVAECDADTLRLLYGDSLSVLFSSILRNMIIPSHGCELFVADFSKIEVAVLWWLAGNDPGLKVLRAGKDPYIFQGASNLGISYSEFVEKYGEDGEHRQLPKAQVLGCGFGMGWEKFQKTAWDMYRLKLSDDQSRMAVNNYRRTNAAVPALWKAYEGAAISAVETGWQQKAGKCFFLIRDKFLWVTLPSKRKLAYREPQLAWRETDYGPRKTLEFWAVNSKTKKWSVERTWGGTLTENIVQGVARDLMMPAMLRLEKADYRALLTVHDEGICERKIGEGNVNDFVKILCEPPPWGADLPIDAKGWKGLRYRK